MASPYQQATFRRKLIYFGLVIALFVVTLLVRGVIAMEGDIAPWTIQGRANDLELTELNQGEAELTGSAIRLLLTGSRGVAICGLWISAIEKQVRHEWNEMELLVKSITKLQPHFVTPWLFQSWNLTYNVSVEMERLNDMYFYIGRGIKLLSEGETLNKNNPDMRYYTAFYYQNKFGVSDKVNTLRCMMQLSCIPPEQRNPNLFLNPDKTINQEAFLKFCQDHPQLVRRLRESTVACLTPEMVLQFLRDNQKVPHRFRENTTEPADRLDQWPILPPMESNEGELFPEMITIGDALSDGYLCARAWYAHSLKCLPPSDPEPSATPTEYDRKKYRVPRQPMLIIFRQGRPRAQSYVAERLRAEGWFDDKPWIVDQNAIGSKLWFPSSTVELKPTDTSKRAWIEAHKMWKEHGLANGLDLTPEQIAVYRRKAQLFCERRGVDPGTALMELRPDEATDLEMKESWDANRRLTYYNQNLFVTNFRSFLYTSEAEMDDSNIAYQRYLYEAERAYKLRGDVRQSIDLYEKAFPKAQDVLARYERFRELEKIQEDLYDANIQYMRLVRERDSKPRRESLMFLQDILNMAPSTLSGGPLRVVTNTRMLEPLVPRLQSLEPMFLPGPMDGVDANGKPWISDQVKFNKKIQAGLMKPPDMSDLPAIPGGPPGMPPPIPPNRQPTP